MKKILTSITVLCLFLFLVACGQGTDNGDTTPIDNNTGNTEVEEETTEDAVPEEDETTTNETETTEETEEIQEGDAAVINGVTLYFADDQIMEIYQVETNMTATIDEDGVKLAYEQWLKGPEQGNLVSLVPPNTTVQSVSFNGDVANVSFSHDILEANLGSGGEGMLIDQIALIAEQFGYGKTQILVDGEIPTSFLGHMDVSEPIEASNPADYKSVN